MSIEVEDLVKFYGTHKAVDQISFSAQPGSVLGFLGPNGAGKSTTMKVITGFIPASAGSVKVCGMNVDTNSLEVRKRVGYLPEHNPLYLDMYVKEALAFICDIHRVTDQKGRISRILELTGLDTVRNKVIGSLSKGFRQRVGIAQAIIPDPEVLILDEPTSGLDPNQVIGIRNLITELGKEKTVILSTHIMQEVEAVCDKVVIIKEGKVVADDRLSDLKLRYNEPKLETIFTQLTNAQVTGGLNN